MKKPTYLILDIFSHPGILIFWKRHGLSVMEQLVPNDFLFTTGDTPLEKLIEKELENIRKNMNSSAKIVKDFSRKTAQQLENLYDSEITKESKKYICTAIQKKFGKNTTKVQDWKEINVF